MRERRRRISSSLGRVVVASVFAATSVVGCGRIMDLSDLGLGIPSREPRLEDPSRRQEALDALLERLRDPAEAPTGEVVLRLSLTGGWGRPDPGELHLTIQDDGRVIRVSDTSVYSSTDDFTTLRLDRDGIVRILGLLEPLLPARPDDLDGGAGVSPTDRSAWLEVGDDIVLSMDRIGETDGYTSEQQSWRARFEDVIERIRSMDWLGDDIVEPAVPWIPSSMTVLARRRAPGIAPDPGTAIVPWPLERPVEAVAAGETLDAQGQPQLVLCLTGEEVPPVFALLTGVNHAHLGVDGTPWELDVRPQYPGYRLSSDPCPEHGS
jgi:hypothetical protein